MRYPESLYSRREFLNAYVGALSACLAGFAVYPAVRFLLPWKVEPEPDSILLPEIPDLAPGQGVALRYGPVPAILIRMADGSFRAFNAICTHFDCTVQYLEGKEEIYCACHQGYYDLDGNVTAGPPPRPLKRYDVALTEEGMVIAQPGLLQKEAKTDVATG